MHTRTLMPAVCLGLLFMAIASQSATYYVSTNGSDVTGDGLNWNTAVFTISNGVAKASSANGNTVLVSNGTYVLSAQIVLANGTTVRSFLGRDVTIIDGNQAVRGFYITSTGAVDGFTISNGCPPSGGGGGVFINGGATLRNCIVSGNKATNTDGYGGGVWINTNAAMVTNCVIAGNTSRGTSQYRGGGGVEIYQGGLVINCVISNNESSRAGGGVNIYEAGILRDSTIIGNVSTGAYANGGGGVQVYNCPGGVGWVSNCTIVGNTSPTLGGGLFLQYRSMAFNCRISNNVSRYDGGNGGGGGVALWYHSSIFNSTIMSNTVLNNGFGGGVLMGATAGDTGGVFNCTIATNSAPGTGWGSGMLLTGGRVWNCLITRNYGGNCPGVYSGSSSSGIVQNCTIVSNAVYGLRTHATAGGYFENCIIYDNSIVQGGSGVSFTNCSVASTNGLAGSGNITNAPAFVNAAGGDYRLTIGSPCVNAGINETWMSGTADLDGYRRIDRMSGLVDIGCYEYIPRGTLFNLR